MNNSNKAKEIGIYIGSSKRILTGETMKYILLVPKKKKKLTEIEH